MCVHGRFSNMQSQILYIGHIEATVFELENFIQPYTGTDFTFLLVNKRT